MAFFLSPVLNEQQPDSNGAPRAGGFIYTYLAGTLTAVTTYKTSTGTAHTNPIQLDSSGYYPNGTQLWLQGGFSYKFVITDSDGANSRTYDNITGVGDDLAGIDQWILYSAMPTYISATSFSVVGDQTNIFEVNRRLKSTNTGGTVYSTISASAFSSGVTTVTVANDSGVLDSGMSAVSYGLLSATNPSIPESSIGAAVRASYGTIGALVRQTIVSGPVDSNGQSAFGGATGSGTVTATGTLIANAANGFGSTGDVNRLGSIANPSWTSLTTNGTMYLWLDVSASGVCTTGSGTLAPVYQNGGTYSTTNNQFTFNISEMVGKVGNGSAAVQTYRVYVGEVTVAGSVVTAITWYALNGRYRAVPIVCTGTATPSSFAHNIGALNCKFQHFLICHTATAGWSIGDVITNVATVAGANYIALQPRQSTRNVCTVTTAATQAYAGLDPSNGNNTSIGGANFNQYMVVERGF